MFHSKLTYFICGVIIFGVASDVALGRPDKLNSLDFEPFPEDLFKVPLDEDEGLIVAKVDDEDEIIELVDNDAIGKEDNDHDVEIHEEAEIDDTDEAEEAEAVAGENSEDEKEDEIVNEEEDHDEDEHVPGDDILEKRHEDDEDKESDDEIIEIEEEILSKDQDDDDSDEAEAAWFEKVRRYFANLGKNRY